MISILIPTYNYNVFPLAKRLHIEATVLGITFEIRVYDDCSSKPFSENEAINTLENCTYKKLPVNIGRSAIRNLLAKEAKFETLLFLDADVMPETENFITNYIKYISEFDVVCGGITYSKSKPEKEKMLRYVYGLQREVKSVAQRNKNKYTVVSANILISKTMFLKVNTALENFYGDDLIISHNLKQNNATIAQIENPVLHLGLEPSIEYLVKSLAAVETLATYEGEYALENNFKNAYLKLKRYRLSSIFQGIIKLISPIILSNLHSKKPNLFLFDLYRLHHYIKIKNNA